jgi:hypothetical protein
MRAKSKAGANPANPEGGAKPESVAKTEPLPRLAPVEELHREHAGRRLDRACVPPSATGTA